MKFKAFPTQKRELFWLCCAAVCALAMCNTVLWGGFNLGFALTACATILSASVYLLLRGHKPGLYSGALLLLSLVLAASFARGDDWVVKAVSLGLLFLSTSLGLCLQAGQNRRSSGSVLSLLDTLRPPFVMGCGKLPSSMMGLVNAFRRTGTLGRSAAALLVGLGVALPVLGVTGFLLMRSDAAFEGLLDLLPEPDLWQVLVTGFLGIQGAALLYALGAGLAHADAPTPRQARAFRGIHPLTVNTVLAAVCFLYGVYLLSQLAYFVGGFRGILPEGYTVAQYARRGFFEMAWLCAIDLGLLVLAMSLVRKTKSIPLSTRLLCLFIGLFTLFLVATASAKMFLYIESFGLTRLRVLTQVIMLFLAVVTVLVLLRLFVTRLPYMQGVVVTALVLLCATAWVDVDTLVARYNVDAYLSGKVEAVDTAHLSSLGDGAVPQIARLLDREETAQTARDILTARRASQADLRGWNYAAHAAKAWLPHIAGLDVLLPAPQTEDTWDTHGFFGDGMAFSTLVFSPEDAAALEAQLAQSGAWREMPLSGEAELDKLVYGRTSFGTMVGPYLTQDGQAVFPRVEKGWYFFQNRHWDAQGLSRDDSVNILFDYYSLNVTVAIYDAEADTLYYCQYDS